MKSVIYFHIFLISLLAGGVPSAQARTLDPGQRTLGGAPDKIVGTTTNFDLVLQGKGMPIEVVNWRADNLVTFSGVALGKTFGVYPEASSLPSAPGVAPANPGLPVATLEAAEGNDYTQTASLKGGAVLSSLVAALRLDRPMMDDDALTIAGTAVRDTQGAGIAGIAEMPMDFWTTPGAGRSDPWTILGPLLAEGIVFGGFVAMMTGGWVVARHRQLQDP